MAGLSLSLTVSGASANRSSHVRHVHLLLTSRDISPDGKWLAVGSGDGNPYVWDLSVQDWQTLACGIAHRNMYSYEWQQFLSDEPFHRTCPDQPVSMEDVALGPALAQSLRNQGNTDEATIVIQEELAWVVAVKDDEVNNTLCWYGSLDGFAAQVMPACEQAVALAQPDRLANDRDSRGIARALTGNTSGAIEDLQAFLDWSKQNGEYDTLGKQREAWIAALKQGKNPFDQTTLDSLKSQ